MDEAAAEKDAFEAEHDARIILGLAKKIAKHVNKDTYIVGLDAKARLATHVLKAALGAYTEVPRRVHFLNFSSRDTILLEGPLIPHYRPHEHESERLRQHMNVPPNRGIYDVFTLNMRNPRHQKALLEWYLKKHVKIPKKANVLLVDEYIESGQSLKVMKEAFEKALGRKVITVALETLRQQPVPGADYTVESKLFRPYFYTPVEKMPSEILFRKDRFIRKEMSMPRGDDSGLAYRYERRLLIDAIRRLSKRRLGRR